MTLSDASKEKQQLRERILSYPLPSIQEREAANASILNALTAWLREQNFDRLGAYMALSREVDLMPMLQDILRWPKVIGVPVMEAGKRIFSFHQWSQDDPLELNPDTHVLQPLASSPIMWPDMVIVPGLAFDRDGHRLGRGRGCYDATLAQFPTTPMTVGVCWSWQQCASLPLDPWDRPVQRVLTEKGWVK
jgi:5-formyltetrahydrofolate cyclo-ligase